MFLGRPRKYSGAQRIEALSVYAALGLTEAAKQTGIPARTIRGWADEAKVAAPAPVRAAAKDLAGRIVAATTGEIPSRAVIEEATLTVEQQDKLTRALVRHELILKIRDVLQRMDEAHVEYFPIKDDVLARTYPKAPHPAVRNYAQAFATLYKEYRLESGESSDRTERVDRVLDVVRDDHERDLLKQVLQMALEEEPAEAQDS